MKRTKIILIMILTIMEVCSIFLTWKSLSHKITIIDDVKFKEENKKEKKAVAIMLNEGDGSYKESTSTTFPKVGYIYNTQKSGCIDTTGKEVVNAISYESGKVSLRLNQKLYCYLYFDKKDAPIIDKFYINDETSNKTTKVPEVTLHLKWSDPYIKEYCISETQDIDSCTWQTSNGVTEIISNYTFTEQTTKTFYAYIKDLAEGISEVKSDRIEFKQSLADQIINNPIPGVQEPTGVAQDELVTRYYGTNPANYICFGTTNKSTCTKDQDKYMYRIIGIDKSNRFKVIKKEALNAAYKWHSLYKINTTWAQSDLKANLNGSIFLTNSGYMPRGWADKIETVNWKYGDIYDASNPNNATNVTAAGMVQKEQAWTTTTSAKIGLIYLADYYFAYHKNGLNCGLSGESSTCKTNWMHLAQNDTSAPVAAEWVISRYGYYSNNGYVAWNIYSSGAVNYSYSNFEYSIRPVFYLKSNIEITGTGTQTDPYIIVN